MLSKIACRLFRGLVLYRPQLFILQKILKLNFYYIFMQNAPTSLLFKHHNFFSSKMLLKSIFWRKKLGSTFPTYKLKIIWIFMNIKTKTISEAYSISFRASFFYTFIHSNLSRAWQFFELQLTNLYLLDTNYLKNRNMKKNDFRF